MKRFILSLLTLVILFGLVVVGMHVWAVYRLSDDVERTYTLKPDQKILFIGSSQFGCSIEEKPEYHNRVLWVSDTTFQSFDMRLRELERRQQLDNVKVCVVPFNFTILSSQTSNTLKWGWYQELPVAWRYLDMLPCNMVSFVAYIAANLRWPFHIHVSDASPVRQPLTERPEKWRQSFFRQMKKEAQNPELLKKNFQGWEQSLTVSLKSLKEVCARHDIRLIALDMPVLPRYRKAIDFVVRGAEKDWWNRIEMMGIERLEVPITLGEADFFDMVHLVGTGATKFTTAVMANLPPHKDLQDEKDERYAARDSDSVTQ